MQSVTLSNGVTMPQLGFGVFQVPDHNECQRAVEQALEVGYRSIDTAALYMNEQAVGDAIAASGIPRDQLFITSKLWIDQAGDEASLRAFDASCAKLGLDTVDLYFVHQPFGDYYGAWRALEKLYAQGHVRAIGVSNFYPDRLVDLVLHADVTPHVNQIEAHPWFQRGADQQLMREHGIQMESWAPLAQGRNGLFENDTLVSIATGHDKTVAQVVLRWLLQRDVVVIPKTVTPERMVENFDVFDFELTHAQMQSIATLDTGASVFLDHRDTEVAKRLSERVVAGA